MSTLAALASLLLATAQAPVTLEGPETGIWRNAQLQTRPFSGRLSDAVSAAAPGKDAAWVGYGVKGGRRQLICCWTSFESGYNPCRAGCALESRKDDGSFSISDHSDCSGGSGVRILYRVQNGKIRRIRTVSDSCPVDAGGMRVVWLEGVGAPESVALLESLIGTGMDGRGKDDDDSPALPAIAVHADASADAALKRLVAAGRPRELRKQAAFWLGNSRGAAGYETLRPLLSDPDEEFRRHLTFCLSQSDDPRALEALIGVARKDADGEVRGQALFWLAQKAGDRAAAEIENAIEDDPDEEVKEAAVFALTQMPKDEGIPELIRVARTNRNAEVRKKAVFWLGQSRDPRAMDFIESLLR
jgi:hypothetical protein